MLKVRASSLHKIMGKPRLKSEVLSETAKSYIIECFKEDQYGFSSFEGNQYTKKGHIMEDEAIFQSSILDGISYEKNQERKDNGFITGECDIFTGNKVIDIKNSWDIGTHCFFKREAEEKTKKSGYDWQLWAYMWLWGVNSGEVHYWLLPTPEEAMRPFDDEGKLITLVNQITIEQRRTVQSIEFNPDLIEEVKEKINHAKEFYNQLKKERNIQ